MMTEVSLKEYFEERFRALEERVEIQHKADQKALSLQAQEYERRLDLLNGEHTRIDKIVANKVDRVEWDEYHKRQLQADYIPRIEFFAFKEQVAMDRSLSIGEMQGKAKITALIYSVVGLVISATTIVVAYIIHKG